MSFQYLFAQIIVPVSIQILAPTKTVDVEEIWIIYRLRGISTRGE